MTRILSRRVIGFIICAHLCLVPALAGVDIRLSTDKTVVCAQQKLTCKITINNKTSDTICFDKNQLRNTYHLDSVLHPDDDGPLVADLISVHGDNFDEAPDVIILKPGKKYSECWTININKLGKLSSTYYEFTVVVGPIYRITETGEQKELKNIEIKGFEIKIINCE